MPPWGVPCSGNSGLTPAFKHRRRPLMVIIDLPSSNPKHFKSEQLIALSHV